MAAKTRIIRQKIGAKLVFSGICRLKVGRMEWTRPRNASINARRIVLDKVCRMPFASPSRRLLLCKFEWASLLLVFIQDSCRRNQCNPLDFTAVIAVNAFRQKSFKKIQD
ncbi:MAG: hypothetical protein ABL888_12480 [Pirellulaceae bacterium]